MSLKVRQKVNECWKPLFIKRNGVRYIIIMGGRGAGRSYVASQYALANLINPGYFRCAIMRLVHGDIRNSIYQEILDRIDDQGVREQIKINDSEMKFRYTIKQKDAAGNVKEHVNSINALGFKASSGDRSAKLKSLASYNTIIIEEAEEIGELEFNKLDDSLRTVKGDITVVLCLNTPDKDHWIINEFFDLQPSGVAGYSIPELKPEKSPYTEFLYFDYTANINNLDPFTVQKYENYKNIKPPYYYQVIKGWCPDEVRGRVYSNWKIIDEVPHEAKLLGRGMDFGWYPDPMHLVNIYWYNGGIILHELLHGNYIKNETVAQTILNDDKTQSGTTIADSAEPKSIAEIRDHGVAIMGVDKSQKGTEKTWLMYRVKTVSGYQISVTRSSRNLIKAYEKCAWLEDKDGNPIGDRDHKWSHPLDALEYGIVELVDNVDPEEEEKEKIQHHVEGINFVNAQQSRYGVG